MPSHPRVPWFRGRVRKAAPRENEGPAPVRRAADNRPYPTTTALFVGADIIRPQSLPPSGGKVAWLKAMPDEGASGDGRDGFFAFGSE